MTKFEARIKEIEERLTKQFNADPDNDCEFLLEAVEKMREALEFYGSDKNWSQNEWGSFPGKVVSYDTEYGREHDFDCDDGLTARQALSDLEQLAGGE